MTMIDEDIISVMQMLLSCNGTVNYSLQHVHSIRSWYYRKMLNQLKMKPNTALKDNNKMLLFCNTVECSKNALLFSSIILRNINEIKPF